MSSGPSSNIWQSTWSLYNTDNNNVVYQIMQPGAVRQSAYMSGPESQLANSITMRTGRQPDEAFLFVTEHAANQMGANNLTLRIDYTNGKENFNLIVSGLYLAGSVSLNRLDPTDKTGNAGSAVCVVRLCDPRSLFVNSGIKAQYNVLMRSPQGTEEEKHKYYDESVNPNGSPNPFSPEAPWKWNEMIDDIWSNLPQLEAAPVTDSIDRVWTDTPIDFTFDHCNAWDAYNDAIETLGLTICRQPSSSDFTLVDCKDLSWTVDEPPSGSRTLWVDIDKIGVPGKPKHIDVVFPVQEMWRGVENDTSPINNQQFGSQTRGDSYKIRKDTDLEDAVDDTTCVVWDHMIALREVDGDTYANDDDNDDDPENIIYGIKSRATAVGEYVTKCFEARQDSKTEVYAGLHMYNLSGLINRITVKDTGGSDTRFSGLVTEVSSDYRNNPIIRRYWHLFHSEYQEPTKNVTSRSKRAREHYPELIQTVQISDVGAEPGSQNVYPNASGVYAAEVVVFRNEVEYSGVTCWVSLMGGNEITPLRGGSYHLARLSGTASLSSDERPLYLIDATSPLSVFFMAPLGGIPARIGNLLGKAWCDVWGLVETPINISDAGIGIEVLNWGVETACAAGDRFGWAEFYDGAWWVVSEDCYPPPDPLLLQTVMGFADEGYDGGLSGSFTPDGFEAYTVMKSTVPAEFVGINDTTPALPD